jgi:hypothetical protein
MRTPIKNVPVALPAAARAARARPRKLHHTTAPITASAEIAAGPQTVFDFLADLRNHVLLAPDSVELRARELGSERAARAIVRLRGPLSIRRTATTAIVDARAPSMIIGLATIGKRTRASISWAVRDRRDHSTVTLRVTVHQAGFLDGVLLRAGCRGWLQRRFADALARLADQFAAAAVPNSRTGESLPLRPAHQPAT